MYHKWWSYDVWFLRYRARQTEKFWKNEKTPGGIIILNISTINENHMMYDSWDVEHDRQNSFSFWANFCPFTPVPPLTTQRIKILKKWKKHLEISSFTQVYHKCQSYDIWFLRYEVHQFFCHLGPLFALLPPNSLKNENFKNHDHRLYCP